MALSRKPLLQKLHDLFVSEHDPEVVKLTATQLLLDHIDNAEVSEKFCALLDLQDKRTALKSAGFKVTVSPKGEQKEEPPQQPKVIKI